MNHARTQSGFTIVELLIVIVIIGVLAAITIIGYNGVSARANTSASSTAAVNFVKKAEVYLTNGGQNRFPIVESELTTAAQSAPFALNGVTINYSVTSLTNASTNSTIRVLKCAATSTATQTLITGANITGLRIFSLNYATNVESAATNIGNTAFCPTSA